MGSMKWGLDTVLARTKSRSVIDGREKDRYVDPRRRDSGKLIPRVDGRADSFATSESSMRRSGRNSPKTCGGNTGSLVRRSSVHPVWTPNPAASCRRDDLHPTQRKVLPGDRW